MNRGYISLVSAVVFIGWLIPGGAGAAQTPLQIVGAWADPRTYKYQQQVQQVIDYYVAYCTRPRTTTYYISSTGNDSTGNGSQALPWQTIAKANSTVAASSGDIAILFKRGDTFNGTTTLSDGGKPFVLFGAYGTGNRPKFTGNAEPNAHAILIAGDGSCVRDVECSGWGNDGNAAYGVAQANSGNAATLVMDCYLWDNAAHNQGHIVSSGVQGGIAVCVRVQSGAYEWSTGTGFVGYNSVGGQWLILDSCYQSAGEDGGATNPAFLMHTGGGAAYPGGLIVRNMYIEGNNSTGRIDNQNPAYLGANNPSPNFAAFGIDQVGYSNNSAAVIGLAGGYMFNSRFQVKPPNGNGMGPGAPGITFNCLYQINCANLSGFNSQCFYHSGTYGNDVNFRFWHNYVEIFGDTAIADGGVFEYWSVNGQTGHTNFGDVRNNIFWAHDNTPAMYIGAFVSPTFSTNAYKGFGTSRGYNLDSAPIDLNTPLFAGAIPSAGQSQTAGIATALPDGVRLEFDYANRPRRVSGQDVGPIEVNMSSIRDISAKPPWLRRGRGY